MSDDHPYRTAGAVTTPVASYPRVVASDEKVRLVEYLADRFAFEELRKSKDGLGVISEHWSMVDLDREVPSFATGLVTKNSMIMLRWLAKKLVESRGLPK